MKRFAGLTACVLLLAFNATSFAIDTETDFSNPALQARYDHLTRELRCLVCQNNSIADSNASLAMELRRRVHAMLSEGKTDTEILTFMTDRYGDFVLYKPPFTPRTWLLWLAPLLFLVGGAFIAWRVVARRSALAISDTNDSEPEDINP